MKDNFSTDQGWRSSFGMIQAHYYLFLYYLFLLLLYHLHLRSSGIRSQRLRTLDLKGTTWEPGSSMLFSDPSMWSNLDSTSSWLWMTVWKVVALCQMGWTFHFLSHSRLTAPQVCRLSLSQALMWRNSNVSAHVLFLAHNMHHDCDSRLSLLSNRSLSILTPSSLSCPPHLCLVSTSRVARICSWCGLQIIIFFFHVY